MMRRGRETIVGWLLVVTCLWIAWPSRAQATTNVLLIWDTMSADTTALVNALQAAGMTVTLSATSETGYDGSNPSPSGFNAVIHLNGTTWGTDMPLAGQNALVGFVSAGGTFVGGEWNAYEYLYGGMVAMRDLILFDRVSGEQKTVTWSDAPGQSAHPVLAHVPSPFSLTAAINVGTVHAFGVQPATVLMVDGDGNDAVAVRNLDAGRVVNFHHAGNYTTGVLSDANIQQLYIDAIGWGVRCGDGAIDAGEQCDLGVDNGSATSCCTASCQLRASDQTCRPATGACDAAESCDGVGDSCPADGAAPDGTSCDDGNACTSNDACAGGLCRAEGTGGGVAIGGQLYSAGGTVDVEVLLAFAGSTSDLYLLEPGPPQFIATNRDTGTVVTLGPFASGTELVFGIYNQDSGYTFRMGPAERNPDGRVHAVVDPVAAGVVHVGFEDLFGGGDNDFDDNQFEFRGGISPTSCDDANSCTTDTCDPMTGCAHAAGNSGLPCRASGGVCDPGEACDGTSPSCPADARSTALCRPAAGECDVAELCDGVGADCPADGKSTALCRAAAGVCDLAESCDGSGDTCPADAKRTAVCRAAAGACDLAESCDGAGDQCPGDVKQPSGTGCDDGDTCTQTDACDGAGSCVGADPLDCNDRDACTTDSCDPIGGCVNDDAAPATGCLTSGKSIVLIKSNPNDHGRDKLLWKWIRGAKLEQTDLADPTDSTDYALCIYAGAANARVAGAALPGGSGWSPLGDKGYKFKGASPDGLSLALLKGGAAAKSKALAKGKGVALPDPILPLAYPVTVQLRKDGSPLCLESRFAASDEVENDGAQFKAKQ